MSSQALPSCAPVWFSKLTECPILSEDGCDARHRRTYGLHRFVSNTYSRTSIRVRFLHAASATPPAKGWLLMSAVTGQQSSRTVLVRIRSALPSLRASEQAIANAVLAEPALAATLSI